MDDQFQVYVNRLLGMTRAEHYRSQFQTIHSSPKFRAIAGSSSSPDLGSAGAGLTWEAVPFPGYTIVTPCGGDDPANAAFYEALSQYQAALSAELPPNFVLPLPLQSLHMTLADLLWDDRYRQGVVAEDFEPKFQGEVAQIFEAYPDQGVAPLRFQTLGFMVMPRALGICLVPDTEATYLRLLEFRRSLYQSPGLLGLGVEQQYHLTIHITLGYFGQIPQDFDWRQLSDRLVQINQQQLVGLPEFVVEQAELRKFDDMTRYYRQPSWPSLRF